MTFSGSKGRVTELRFPGGFSNGTKAERTSFIRLEEEQKEGQARGAHAHSNDKPPHSLSSFVQFKNFPNCAHCNSLSINFAPSFSSDRFFSLKVFFVKLQLAGFNRAETMTIMIFYQSIFSLLSKTH